MKCPYCREGDFAVIDSRRNEGGFPIRRRRSCDHCKRKVWTVETIQESPLKVVKKDDSREAFDPAKLRRGLERACYKRPVSVQQIDSMVRRIEEKAYATYSGEIPARVLGNLAMKVLKKADKVAYVRFASVYREFTDVGDFVQEVEAILTRNTKNGANRGKG
jgi:transcriptional repressor NrdR